MSSTMQIAGHGTNLDKMGPEHIDRDAWDQAVHEATAAAAPPAKGQPNPPTITQQLDKLDGWEAKVRQRAAAPAEAIQHPLHGITTGTAKMQQPRQQLNGAFAALDQADKIKKLIRDPGFASRPHAEQVKMAQHVDTLIGTAQERLRTASAEAHEANDAILKKRADQAGAAANVSKTVFELAPKLMDALITSKLHLPLVGKALAGATTLTGQIAAQGTNKLIGGAPDATKPLGSPQETVDKTIVDVATAGVAGKLPEGARKEIGEVAGDALKEALANADKARLDHKGVEDIRKEAVKGAEDGMTGKLADLVGKGVPQARTKAMIHVIATAIGAAVVAKLNHEDPKAAALGGAQKAATGDVVKGAAGAVHTAPAPNAKPK